MDSEGYIHVNDSERDRNRALRRFFIGYGSMLLLGAFIVAVRWFGSTPTKTHKSLILFILKCYIMSLFGAVIYIFL